MSWPRWGNGAFWFGVLLCAASCKISQPYDNSPDACAIGELCGDGGASEALSTMPTPSPTTTAQTSTQDSTPPPAAICPGDCLPDDLEAKECAGPPVIKLKLFSQIVLDGGTSLDASVSVDAGALDASLVDPIADASLDASLDGAGDGGSADSSSTPREGNSRPIGVDTLPTSPGGGNATPLSCQLVSINGEITAGCAASGTGVEGSVCTSASDCAPGYGCVGELGAGKCLRYCCGGNEACAENRYCEMQPMRSLEFGEDALSVPEVPVCVEAEQCSLDVVSDGDGRDAQGPASCPAGTACTIVRANTTACRPMGSGKEGDACPCGGGFFCSKVTNSCLKLCSTADPSSCGKRECQPGPSGFPDGWGLCVGG